MRGIEKYGEYSAKNGLAYMGGGRFFKSPEDALVWGIQHHDVAAVAAAVEQGVDLNMRFGDLEYAIIYAAKMRSTVILQLLLENGANPNVFHSSGMTPLAFASAFAGIESIKMLLESGADPNILHEERAMPVLVAAAIRCNVATAYFWDDGEGKEINAYDGMCLLLNGSIPVHHSAMQLLLEGFLRPQNGRFAITDPEHRIRLDRKLASLNIDKTMYEVTDIQRRVVLSQMNPEDPDLFDKQIHAFFRKMGEEIQENPREFHALIHAFGAQFFGDLQGAPKQKEEKPLLPPA